MVPSRLPFLLSMTAGSVDTAGFLALNGFFAAHVTANFVTLTSSIVQGNTPWIIAKPLVLPVFFMTVIMIRMVSIRLTVRWAGKEIRILLAFQVVCFLAASLLLLVLNTSDGREWLALLPGGMALSVLSHVFIILAYVSCGASLVTGVSATQYFVAIPVVMLLHALPISLGGLGVRELGTVGVLVWMGAGQQTAMTLSLVLLALYWVSVLPGLLLALAMGLSWRDIKGSGRVSR